MADRGSDDAGPGDHPVHGCEVQLGYLSRVELRAQESPVCPGSGRHQYSGRWRIESMNESGFQWAAGVGDLWVTRQQRVCDCAAVRRSQRHRGHSGGLVDREHGGIVMDDGERELWLRFELSEGAVDLDMDDVAGSDKLAFASRAAVHADQMGLDRPAGTASRPPRQTAIQESVQAHRAVPGGDHEQLGTVAWCGHGRSIVESTT